MANPKTTPTDNARNRAGPSPALLADREGDLGPDPDDWVSGDEPMTGAQASYLKTLSEQANEPGSFSENLTKAKASKLIDRLREKGGLGEPYE